MSELVRRDEPESAAIVERCCARVGFLGNPSDGFQGKTLSFLVNNFAATVTITPSTGSLTIIEEAIFEDILHVQRHSTLLGYSSGMRLVQATCKVFCQKALQAGVAQTVLQSRGGELRFHTTIPRMVGLSGSSAIITATFCALLRLYSLSLEELHISKEELPAVLLSIEQDELGIKAGLQDRVIQAYGGLVSMDFSGGRNVYASLDPALLPPLYLLYNIAAGGDSGAVHSTVRQRYEQRDPEVLRGMEEIASLAEAAARCLLHRRFSRLADLMERNFALRRRLYGDDVVGARNIAAAELARSLGYAVKFTGSGGSFIALNRLCISSKGKGKGEEEGEEEEESVRWLSEAEEAAARALFASKQFAMVRVQLPDLPSYHL